MIKTLLMLGIICLLALIIELDFFLFLPKFGAEHFGAPDDLKELVKKIPDKPKSVEVFGIVIMVISFIGVISTLIFSIIDTYFSYGGFLTTLSRFLIIFEGYKLFDVICFDYLLLTKIRLPERLYPLTKGAKGYDSFGFNFKSQIIKAVIFAFIALLIALIFMFIYR